MRKIFRYALLIASVAGLISCDMENTKNSGGERKPLPVDGEIVHPTPFDKDLLVTANLYAWEEVVVKAPVSGTVLKIYFQEGSPVQKSASLIRLDDRSWRARLSGLRAELKTAKKDLERKESLLAIEGSTQEEVDQAYSRVQTLQADINQLEVNISLANVKAPFSGQLGMRDFSEGAYLQEGEEITSLTKINPLKVDFSIPEEYAKSIAIDKKIKLLVNNDTLSAKIYAVSPVIDPNSRTIRVRANLPQPENKLVMPGAFSEIILATDYIENALMVPTQAVVPEIENQTIYVYKKGKAIRKEIELGSRTAAKVHVRKGLSAGDTIITTGLLEIRSGMDVSLKLIK